jgi:putative hydrolase of the HAD superfamily
LDSARIRCVVFDVGGVLVEVGGVAPMLRWMPNPTDVEGLWRAWLHSAAVRDFERGRIDAQAFGERLVAEFELSVGAQDFLDGFVAWVNAPLPGAQELLKQVRPGIVRATLSNTNVLHWSRIMHDMGFQPHFDHHFASHLIDRIKPDHDAFEHVAATVGFEPREILFVDDNQINVDAARAFGMQAERCVGTVELRSVLLDRGLLASPE